MASTAKIGNPGVGLDGPLAVGMYSYAELIYYARGSNGALYYYQPTPRTWGLVDRR